MMMWWRNREDKRPRAKVIVRLENGMTVTVIVECGNVGYYYYGALEAARWEADRIARDGVWCDGVRYPAARIASIQIEPFVTSSSPGKA